MSPSILPINRIDKTQLGLAGGKGANLGELCKIDGIKVPDGFCVTTEVYKEIFGSSQQFNELLEKLENLKANDRTTISEISAKLRKLIEDTPIPERFAKEITLELRRLGETNPYAVRSSATAEDLPSASFAGQQDSYLNVIGKENILRSISRCWASLFTDRAVIYRIQNGFEHRKVGLSVVVQKMVFPDVAGIMFTADPVSGNRKVVSIDASFGLGEALVSGLVNADNYRVRDGRIIDRKISTKKLAVVAANEGGTKKQDIETNQQTTRTLTDEQILQLESLGRKIEAWFGKPQDIEWCLQSGEFYVVQSRPITTLFPVPKADDRENHVYISVGHQQMMTDAIRPLGLSFFLLTTKAVMRTAGGRLFVDVTNLLASPDGRQKLIDGFGKYDPLIKDALMTVIEQRDLVKPSGDDVKDSASERAKSALSPRIDPQIENNPGIVSDLIITSQASLEALRRDIETKSGTDVIDFISDHITQSKNLPFNEQGLAVIMTAMTASWWINEKMEEWLGEKGLADILSQSVPNNVTSEMGLALLDVADVIRPHAEVVDYLQHVKDDNFLDALPKLPGGHESREAIIGYLSKYGMRCPGEIDITRTRWSEKPITLVPLILSNIRNFQPGAGKRKFQEGLREALNKEQEVLDRLKRLPDAEQKIAETKRMITLIRNFSGYREYPKYYIVSRYFIYKQALLKEAGRLVAARVIHEKEDIYYLTFEELKEVVRTRKLDNVIIDQRKEEYKLFEKLTPPRVITSEGEIFTGKYKRENVPAGALPGLAVSSGVIEGRARVILNMQDADIEEGDILVTAFTDPSWTPLFVSIKGLVTEVGGLMTHGAVIAREYGLPAVVGVENATTLIKDGQRIRVNGTEGWVEIL